MRRAYTGKMEKNMETTIIYGGYIGIIEKKMESTIMGYIGFRVVTFQCLLHPLAHGQDPRIFCVVSTFRALPREQETFVKQSTLKDILPRPEYTRAKKIPGSLRLGQGF